MIQLLQMVSDGEDCLVRLGCTCGDPALSMYNGEDDQILFCTRCGEITTSERLLSESPLPVDRDHLIWLNVANRAECPLVNVSIPVVVGFAPSPEGNGNGGHEGQVELPAVVTKLSTDKCFLRLEESSHLGELDGRRQILIRAEEIPLGGETAGQVEEVLHPRGPNGPAYYKVRLILTSPQRKSELESFFQSTCGLKFDWRVLLYADLDTARQFRLLLRECLPMARIEVASNAVDFMRHFREHTPDLSLLPPIPELMQTVGQTDAAADHTTHHVIALLKERTASAISQALRWGANDVLPLNCDLDDMRRAIQRCQKDGSSDDPDVSSSEARAPEWKARELSITPDAVSEEDAIRMLCVASETHDPNSSSHLNRLAAYAAAIAHELGLSHKQVARLATASKLHDMGKLGVPDEILHKTGTLTEDERAIMQQHARRGYHILHASTSELMRLGATIALRHHERYDGKGYPDGVAGEAIPIEAQIVSVADVFDALTTARAYKPAWPNEKTIAFMQEQAGKMFAPKVIEAFMRVLPEIERDQLRFLDDFRDIWTERRASPRYSIAPVPLNIEIALPERSFQPILLYGHLCNISLGGLKVMLNNVSLDLFTLLISSRRYTKLGGLDGGWGMINQSFCSVSWIDYYAVPDPDGCLMGLSFQKEPEELDGALERLAQTGR